MFAWFGTFPQTRVRRGFPGGSRFVVPWRGGGGTGRLTRRVRNPLMNQNLLYLVFKCLLSTKHSGSGARLQAVFHAQDGCRKRRRKTGRWRSVSGICNDHPPLVHRLAHYNRRRRTVGGRCAFATEGKPCCAATKKPQLDDGRALPAASVDPHVVHRGSTALSAGSSTGGRATSTFVRSREPRPWTPPPAWGSVTAHQRSSPLPRVGGPPDSGETLPLPRAGEQPCQVGVGARQG